MRKFFVLIVLIVGMVAPALADSPLLIITLQHDKDLNSLHIASSIEWNRDDLNEQKREKLEKNNIFYSKPEGNKFVRQYKVGDKNIRVEMVFPKREQGRRLNESTRVELSLYNGERLFFQSQNFGQHSEEYTIKPKSGVKFRPQSLSLYKVGELRLKVAGIYGKEVYSDGLGIDKGLTFDYFIGDIIDDNSMNDAASRVNSPSPNE